MHADFTRGGVQSKVWQKFSLEFGGEIGYSRNYAQWHMLFTATRMPLNFN
jgi:hypothetical protein